MLEYSTGIEDNLYKFNYISMRKRTTLLLKSFFKASLSLFFIFHTLAPSVLATGDLLSTQKESVSDTAEDTAGEITKEAVSDPESIVKEGLPYRETKLPGPNLKNRGGQYSISSTSGIWTSVTGGSHVTGVNTSEVRWGKSNCMEKVCVEYGWFGICKKYEYQNRCSGLGFNGTADQSFNADEKILLGDLSHFNWPTNGGANGAKLKITLNFANPALTPSPTFTYDFKLEETTNSKPCPPWHGAGHEPCDDRVTFPNAYGEEVFTIGDTKYTLKIDGFQDKYPEGTPLTGFVTEENKENKAYLVGHLSSVLIEKPAISLIKKVNGDDANNPTGPVVAVGDTVNFEYIVQNTGNVALSGINVADDKGVSVTCPQTTLESGKSMTCTGSAIAVAGQYKNTGTVTTTSHPSVSASDVAHYYGVEKINICHATHVASHQYSKEEISMTPNVQGHDDHNGDIIPPFSNDLVNYPGKNWDEYGKSIYNNDCKVPSGTLTVKKVVTPDSDTTSFDITGTGTTSVAGAPTFLDGNTGTISGTQSKTFTVYPGTYSVTEQLPEGWRQVSNTCTDVVIAKGESKECTITNTKEAKLTIVKIAYPGSDQEFTFTSSIPENNTFTLKDTNSSPDVNGSKPFNLAEGIYSVSENDTEGWEKTSASCSNQDEISSIKLKPGDSVTCTFVNTKYGSISGHKWNDADGLADTTDDRTPVEGWTIFIDANGNGVLDDGEKKTTTGPDGKYSFANLLPGTYTIAEVLTAGWIQLGGLSQSITITAGEDKENVDFVNVKYPTIQVKKKVDTNGDGTVDIENATDWQWKIDSETHNTGSAPIAKMPGKYTISEMQKPNYHVTSMVCTNNGVEIVDKVGESEEITLKSGDNVVCTFTNARNLGKLIIEKEVINDNGGSKKATDFSFQIGSETPIEFTQNGANELLGKNEYVRYAGLEYSITEVEANQEGYTTTYENCTNITVPYNGEVVCKIKNYDNKPSLTLVKEVKNDNGGELVATDWTLTATGPTTIEGDGGVTSGDNFEAGTYTLSEVGKPTIDVSRYKAGKWNCTNNVTVNENNQITLGLGQSTTCTIVNDDIAPSLELVKVVDNKYGGNAQATSWTLTATGPTTIEGAGGVTSDDNFEAGTYTLSEVGGVSGYEAGTWSCTNGVTVDANNGITLKAGQSTVCTITNTEIQPTLTLIKVVKNENGGTKTVSDFSLYIGNDKVTSGVAKGVNSNVEYTVREDQLDGYEASSWTGDCSADGKITLKSGENKTCTITNSDIAPSLTVKKHVKNDNGGNADISKFEIKLNDDALTFDTGVVAGDTTTYTSTPSVVSNTSYSLSEKTDVFGYNAGTWTCKDNLTNAELNPSSLKLNEGQSVTCEITNDDIAPKLTVIKHVVNNGNDGLKQASDFTIKVDGTNVSNTQFSGSEEGVTVTLNQGEFKVTEIEDTENYTATYEGCEGSIKVGESKTCKITNTGKDHIPAIEVTKTADKTSVEETGENVTFTFTVKNTSKVDTVEILSLVDSVYGNLDGDHACKVGNTLAPNAVCSFTLTKNISGDASGNPHKNTFTATVKDDEQNEVSGSDDETITFTDVKPSIEVLKTANVSEIPETGGEVTFTFKVTNRSLEKVTITSLEDDVIGTLAGDEDCKVGTELEAGKSCEFQQVFTIPSTTAGDENAPTSHQNIFTATVEDNEGNKAEDEDEEEIKLTPVPSLKLVKKVVHKYNSDEDITEADWVLSALPDNGDGFTYAGDTNEFRFVKAGVAYLLSETGKYMEQFEASDWSCTGGELEGSTLTLSATDDVVCTITNTAKPVTIKVIKELYDYTGREILSNQEFPINLLDGDGRPVANGTIVTVDNPEDAKKFEGLNKGKYSVREVEMPDGYVSEGCHATGSEIIEANNGETIEFICKNRIVNPLLEIEKTNNTIGTPKHAGEQVLYTITVKAPKDDDDSSKYVLKNVVVNDLAPAGFAYDGGSWTAISSLRGNIAGVEPTYNGTDFAKWELGDMVEGEVVTLTYTTTISPTQDPGKYPDVAWTKGSSLTNEEILGNVSTGADTPFVGTEVEVIALDEMEEGEVLGASTSMRLPNTGAKTYLTIGAIIAMLVGLFTIFNDDKKKKFALKGVILSVVALLLPTAIFAGYFAVEIETPKTPTKVGTYDIAFFATNTEKKIVKVECFEDGVSFQTLDNVNSGKCKVSGKTGGTYKYYVEATDEDGTKKQSKEVTIAVDLTKPSVVENYKKDGNVLKFKTANDGRTEKVEIFRSEKPSFIANASTFLAEVKCAPNTECTYTDSTAVAGKTYYYAIRAVDNIGNTSGFVSDEKVITVAEKTGTTTNVSNIGNTTTTGSTTVTTEEDKSGTVAGESDTKDDSTKKSENEHSTTKSTESKTDVKSNTETESTNVFKKFWYLWLCGLLILIGGIYTYVKKADKES